MTQIDIEKKQMSLLHLHVSHSAGQCYDVLTLKTQFYIIQLHHDILSYIHDVENFPIM